MATCPWPSPRMSSCRCVSTRGFSHRAEPLRRDPGGKISRIAPLFPRIRVVAARAQREADRDADEAEGLAQAVDEIALVALGDSGDRIAEQDEERRTRLGLGDVANLHLPPGDGRRRRRLDPR